MNCTRCNKQVKDEIDYCPYCRTNTYKQNEQAAYTPKKPVTRSNLRSSAGKPLQVLPPFQYIAGNCRYCGGIIGKVILKCKTCGMWLDYCT
jgi:RNA polymerase subunit RPABC4/transcription elongation factor Spt4